MKYRSFGRSGEQVSEIGLGCWQLSGNAWGDLDEKNALDILSAAADAGVNFLDTADVYGTGRSESLIGKFLKSRPAADFFIATKLGRTDDLYPDKYTEAGVRAALEASLRRLGIDTVSLVQLHCVPAEILRQGEIFDWLRTLQQEGKIRHFGASVEDSEQANLCLAQSGLASLQIIFNIFRQSPTTTILPAAQEKGVAIIVRLPLASGLLSGRFTKDTHFAENDHRNFNRDGQAFHVGETFAGIPFDKGVELADEMKLFVRRPLPWFRRPNAGSSITTRSLWSFLVPAPRSRPGKCLGLTVAGTPCLTPRASRQILQDRGRTVHPRHLLAAKLVPTFPQINQRTVLRGGGSFVIKLAPMRFTPIAIALALAVSIIPTMAQNALEEGKKFLAENAKKEGVVTTPSGLQYIVLKEGTGKKPKATDTVLVHYRGTLLNGKEFDSSYSRNEPIEFPLNRVIPAGPKAFSS